MLLISRSRPILFFYKTVYVSFLILFLTACQGREVTIPLVFEGEKLVLWGKLEARRPVRIQVMKTFPATGPIPGQTAVTDATVYLYKNGSFSARLTALDGNGIYGSDQLIEAGQTYVIRVEAAGLPTAESTEVTVPLSVPEFQYIRKRNAEPETSAGPRDHIAFYFKENGQLHRSYLILGFNASFTDDSRPAYADPSADNRVANEEDCHTWADFYDRTFGYLFMMNGACIPYDAPVSFYVPVAKYVSGPNSKGEYVRARTIRLLMASVSREWFIYNRIEEKQPEGLDHLVFPPQEAYTNVKNGYGIIYGYTAIQTDLM